jgi:peptide/nickel transport system permease protein
MKFLRTMARRLATALLTLLLVSMLVFSLAHLAPGDALAGDLEDETLHRLSHEQRSRIRALYHLDEPLHLRYGLWLRDLLSGNLGRSFHDNRRVSVKIAERIGITLTINLLSLGLMIVLAVPLGTLSALRPGSRMDRWAGVATYALYAVPVFWAALLLQIVFSVRLDWLPVFGLSSDGVESFGWWVRLSDRAAHLVLPVLCLSLGGLAYLSRFVRTTLLDNELFESARAARARGMSTPGVLIRHGFRQASVPMLTLAGFILPGLVGGSVIVERIFAIPGLGSLFVDAMFQRDIPVIMALTLLSAAATLMGILMADLAYSVADPRVRRG